GVEASISPSPRTPAWKLVGEVIGLMVAHPWLLAFAVLPNVISPAVAPIQAWFAKEVLEKVSKGEHLFRLDELLTYAPYAIVLFVGLTLLRIAEKVSNRMYDDRLVIEVQRRWFEVRGEGCAGDHIAKAVNDCKNFVKLS